MLLDFFHLYAQEDKTECYIDDCEKDIVPYKTDIECRNALLILVKNLSDTLPPYLQRQVIKTSLQTWAKKQQDRALFLEVFGPKNQQKSSFSSLWNFLFPEAANKAHMSTNMYGEECITQKIKDVIAFFNKMPFSWWIQESDDPQWMAPLLTKQGFRRIDFEALRIPSLTKQQEDVLADFGLLSLCKEDISTKERKSFVWTGEEKDISLLGWCFGTFWIFLCPKNPAPQHSIASTFINTFPKSIERENISLFVWNDEQSS